jgi:hypothetical protein
MSDNFGCKSCGRSHMGGLSCFYGISKRDRQPVTKSSPSGRKSSVRKLLKNTFRKLESGISFKQYVRSHAKSQRSSR